MTEQELATCHCIIGHPHKAKFLVIKHQSGWMVPTLKFPPAAMDFRAGMISQGVQRKYGIATGVLRTLVNTPLYHCIELEVRKGSGSKNLKAVWFDREQYEKLRTAGDVSHDPFDQWLREKEQGIVPDLRPAWEIPGWFQQADHWIHFQADAIGLQVTGSVEQYKAGWNHSCLLSVSASEGKLFFKAACASPPGEAALTMALAEKWPEHVFRPLAVDCERNWLLQRDWYQGGKIAPELHLLPEFARVLAKIQVESMDCKDAWRELGCPVHDLGYLLEWIKRKDELLPSLLEGPDRLSELEVSMMVLALDAYADACQQLLELDIPTALVHTDFRQSNLVERQGSLRIFNWAGAVIGHPFMALDYFNSQRARFDSGNAVYSPEDKVSEALAQEIDSAYLEGFLAFAPMEKLEQAWALTCSLFPLWHLYRVQEAIVWAEKDCGRYSVLARQLKHNARQLIATKEGTPSQAG